MIIFAGEGGIVTGVLLLKFTVFLFIVSRVAPVLLLKNALLAPKEAYIAEGGIFYEGTVYPLHSFPMRMAELNSKKERKKGRQCLSSRSPQLIGLNILLSFDIEIPVPEGNEETVCKSLICK